jgi:hypothetical protein
MNSMRGAFNDLMRKHHRQGVLLGETTASTPEDYFGFSHNQVTGVHFHKAGVSAGYGSACAAVVSWTKWRCRPAAIRTSTT